MVFLPMIVRSSKQRAAIGNLNLAVALGSGFWGCTSKQRQDGGCPGMYTFYYLYCSAYAFIPLFTCYTYLSVEWEWHAFCLSHINRKWYSVVRYRSRGNENRFLVHGDCLLEVQVMLCSIHHVIRYSDLYASTDFICYRISKFPPQGQAEMDVYKDCR